MSRLLNAMIESNDNGWFQGFMDALQATGKYIICGLVQLIHQYN